MGELDLEGSPRVKSGKIDIGCYQRKEKAGVVHVEIGRESPRIPEDHCGNWRRLGHPNFREMQLCSSKMIGIQIGAVSFVDEGTEKVLDVLQERACVNTLFLAVFTYGRGIAGRQIPGQPLPDHGKQEYDLNFHGGNFATPHPQYYKNTVLKDTARARPRRPGYPGRSASCRQKARHEGHLLA